MPIMKSVYGGFPLLILLLIAITGCIGQENEDVPVTFIDVSVSQAKDMIDSGGFFLLDVRTQEEYDEAHISGSTLIPVEVIGTRLDEIPKDREILVYCRSGRRSADASQILIDNGFKPVYNMKGGINEWTNSGYEVEK
jgi:rhodanese-related sulfurtransferase